MCEQTKCHLQLPALQPSLAQDPVSACLWQDRWTGLSLGCNCSSRCSQGPILRTRRSLSPPEPIEATRIRCCLHGQQKPKPITPWWMLWCEVAGEKLTHIPCPVSHPTSCIPAADPGAPVPLGRCRSQPGGADGQQPVPDPACGSPAPTEGAAFPSAGSQPRSRSLFWVMSGRNPSCV